MTSLSDQLTGPVLDVHVPGHPVPQGSLRSLGRGRVVADNPRLASWRGDVARVARSGWRGRDALSGPVSVALAFTLPLPATAPKSWAARPRWATPHRQRTGDVDKLARAILDALTTAGVYGDDAQVCHLSASKSFGPSPGARITVSPAPATAGPEAAR